MKPTGVPWPIYLRNGVGKRFSRFGERIGSQWLTYNPLIMLEYHDMAVANAPGVVNALTTVFPQGKRVFDVGSGSGAYAAEFLRRGYTVLACEHSASGRKLARQQGVECREFDLTQPVVCRVQESFDLIYCFEIAEHMPPELGLKLVRFLAKFPAVIVFTAAQPGQGGTGHINEQPEAYWRQQFMEAGLGVDAEQTQRLRDAFQAEKCALWFERNAIVFPVV